MAATTIMYPSWADLSPGAGFPSPDLSLSRDKASTRGALQATAEEVAAKVSTWRCRS